MVIDNDNMAWFSLAGVDESTVFCIGLNVQHVTAEEAVIPQTMFDQYGLEEESHLLDKNGVQYKITGRASKWSITGTQFAIYVAVFAGGLILIVAIVMIALNQMKKAKEKYANIVNEESDEEVDEEALRMEIMRELLKEHKGNGKED